MFESLSEKLEVVFKSLRSRGILKEADVDEALKEVRLALLEADVNFRVVKDFVAAVREKAVGSEVLESLSPGQQVIKIVYGELCELLGGKASKIHLSPNPPTVLMMTGLQGSGKTTTSAKLARLFKKEGRRPMLVAADLQRPAAIDQLIALGKKIEVPAFYSKEAKDPVSLCLEAVKKARLDAHDIVILDTAGRLHIDEGLMNELKEIKSKVNPAETLFVADAMTGQDSVNVAGTFNGRIGIDGIIFTKMDGDARGGAALSVRHVTGKPIKYIGVGEKIEMLEIFHPDRIASRILGMGDTLSLIEQAQKAYDSKEAGRLQERFLKEIFTFEDLKDQMKKIRSMGSLESLLNMIPGMSRVKNVRVDDREFVRIEAIINSMTQQERRNHRIIDGSRRRRIASGSGTTVADVNRVIKQYIEMKKMLKMIKGKKGLKLPGFPPL